MDFTIKNLGTCTHQSPILRNNMSRESAFVDDTKKMRWDVMVRCDKTEQKVPNECFELAGQREMVYFDAEETKSAIVTCGGLCPGINDVIRSIVMETYYRYGSKKIYGIRYGYRGLAPDAEFKPVELCPNMVKDIHMDGGSILSSSRGGMTDKELLVDTIEEMGINILYTIGGDGTLRGAHEISELAKARGLDLAVVGIPKTVDNDISFIQRSFGFETAFAKAVDAIYAAHVEAEGAPNGIGLVKLMGRHSGFIAASAALAMNDVNFVLVPEVEFELDGPNGFLHHLEERIKKRHHAVICVAEGTGQELLKLEGGMTKYDKSGNVVLEDIGKFMKSRILDHFNSKNIEVNLKYIDPSYIIRSSPATANDSVFCALLGQYAVHAGMAGKTDLVIGQWNNIFTHVPIPLAISKRKTINPNSRFWNHVIEATGQPIRMVNR